MKTLSKKTVAQAVRMLEISASTPAIGIVDQVVADSDLRFAHLLAVDTRRVVESLRFFDDPGEDYEVACAEAALLLEEGWLPPGGSVRNPYDRLVAFEKRHGEYLELLDRKVTTQSKYEDLQARWKDYRGSPPQAVIDAGLAAREAARLFRYHNDLIQQWCGYIEAHRELKREAQNPPQEGTCPYA